MRKIILTGILIFAIVIGFMCTKTGITFPCKVHSYKELKEKRQETNQQLDNLTTLKSSSYSGMQTALARSVKSFKSTKTMYDAAMESKTDVEKERAIAGTSYDLSYLWVKLGNYATENNCDLTIEVFQNQETSEDENYVLCDFKFNIVSAYSKSISFIEKISTDNELNFIPENLKMYSEYRNVNTMTWYDGTFMPEDPNNPGKPVSEEVTMLMLITEFYKTNVPVAKTSLSKVENQLTVQNEENENKNTNTTNTTNATNQTNKTNNTVKNSNNTTAK